MLSIDQAIAAILERATPLPARPFPIEGCRGLMLAEEIVADIDLPPFDKALMDGYAVRSVDLVVPGEHRLRIVEEVTAGQVPTRPVGKDEATRIMTGAPLPHGADAVVMHERTRLLDASTVSLDGPIPAGQSLLPQGREMRAGDILLEAGTRINAVKLGLIASAGRAEVRAIPLPRITVIPNGDELVPIHHRPGPGQIRDTNGITLAALAQTWGAQEVSLARAAPDDPTLLRQALAGPLDYCDVLIISGGVSAGTRDLVPSTLVDLGVVPVFHQVKVKPGKPLWFGVFPGTNEANPTLVFGLPGNPASSVVGFVLFVKPALDALAGRPPLDSLVVGNLAARFVQKGDRPTYYPASFQDGLITPLAWSGSADLRTVAVADGFAVFPGGDRTFEVGQPVNFLPIHGSRPTSAW